MITDTIKISNICLSSRSNHSPGFGIYHSHIHLYTFDHVYVISEKHRWFLQVLNFYINWYFTVYIFCFSLPFFNNCSELCFWDLSMLVCILIHLFWPFYKQSQFNFTFSSWWGFFSLLLQTVLPQISLQNLFVAKNKYRSASPALLDAANLLSKVVLIYNPTIRDKISVIAQHLCQHLVLSVFNVCQSDWCEMASICIYLTSDEVNF